jgi:hypothetical protein
MIKNYTSKISIFPMLAWIPIFVGIALFLYGAFWVGKTVSYKLFYEDMVRFTVQEMVKSEALKK